MAAPLKRGGLGRARLLAIVTATGMSVPVAAVAGFYLACNEIIPESHSHGNERRATFGLLVGVVGIMVLKVVVGE